MTTASRSESETAPATQRQLDVYGEVMDALHQARAGRCPPDAVAWEVQRELLSWLETGWREPDSSLWEIRGPARHFVHSKVMAGRRSTEASAAWRSSASGSVDRWRTLRDEIHDEVSERGSGPERCTFTQSYWSTELDASLLMIPLAGFLPTTHERVRGTIDAVRRELGVDGLVERYPTEYGMSVDGLPGKEGALWLCSFWLADALAVTGRHEEAAQLFDAGTLNRRLVLQNDVVFGSVNANRAHYDAAAHTLSAADPVWLACLTTRRVPLDSWVDGLQQPDDVKVVVDLG